MSFMGGAITEKKLVKADFLRQYHTKKKALGNCFRGGAK
jgi:hypothetical protein